MARRLVMISLAAGLWASAQTPERAPIASQPVVRLRGTVSKVTAAPGRGMPSMEIQDGKTTTQVLLGSMRYLMENEFNPKAGDAVEVKGYKMGEQVVAIEVALPSEKKTLKLRDENGWPLWMRGQGPPMGRQAGKAEK